jgi:hypothetical protein
MFTIFGVSIVLCFIKILYGNRNFILDSSILSKLFSLEVQ